MPYARTSIRETLHSAAYLTNDCPLTGNDSPSTGNDCPSTAMMLLQPFGHLAWHHQLFNNFSKYHQGRYPPETRATVYFACHSHICRVVDIHPKHQQPFILLAIQISAEKISTRNINNRLFCLSSKYLQGRYPPEASTTV